jgi:hypothetical protein
MSDRVQTLDLDANVIIQPGAEHIARGGAGARRLVKLIPLPGRSAAPAIWTGAPVEGEIDGEKLKVRVCIVLMGRDPKPFTAAVTVPDEFYQRLPDVPVEW